MESIKKITMFGATGMTGSCALDVAINIGLKVKLLLRDPAKLPSNYNDKVEVVQGNVTNIEDVEKAITGAEGVVVVLGTRNNLEPTTELSTGMDNIIAAIKKIAPTIPVSVCLSSFLFFPPGSVPPVFKNINAEHERMLKSLESSGLKYIAVFPPHIADQPKAEYVTKHGQSPGGRIISKYELAEFLVKSLDMKEHHCQKIEEHTTNYDDSCLYFCGTHNVSYRFRFWHQKEGRERN